MQVMSSIYLLLNYKRLFLKQFAGKTLSVKIVDNPNERPVRAIGLTD